MYVSPAINTTTLWLVSVYSQSLFISVIVGIIIIPTFKPVKLYGCHSSLRGQTDKLSMAHMGPSACSIICQLFVYVKILLSCGQFCQELVNAVCELTVSGSTNYT